MVRIIAYDTLGHINHGWLDARHHFSFASYHNPHRMGFGTLLVINDDIISAGKGFATHPHRNMEIITYVRKGSITHQDSMGNTGCTNAGDVQIMSAGSGVFHSEYNLGAESTTLYQIWIVPNQKNVPPRWECRQFPKEKVTTSLPVLVSGMAEHSGQNPLFIYQDAAIYGGVLKKGVSVTQNIKHQAYILLSSGSAQVNSAQMQQGDGAEIEFENHISITATSDAEILIIDAPKT